MVWLPAQCWNCGYRFFGHLPFSIAPHVVLVSQRNVISCPSCRGRAEILDGVYESLEKTFARLKSARPSEKDVRTFCSLLNANLKNEISDQDLQKKSGAIAPQFGDAASDLVKTPLKNIIFVFLLALLATCKFEVNLDLNEAIQQYLKATEQSVNQLSSEGNSEHPSAKKKSADSNPSSNGPKKEDG